MAGPSGHLASRRLVLARVTARPAAMRAAAAGHGVAGHRRARLIGRHGAGAIVLSAGRAGGAILVILLAVVLLAVVLLTAVLLAAGLAAILLVDGRISALRILRRVLSCLILGRVGAIGCRAWIAAILGVRLVLAVCRALPAL